MFSRWKRKKCELSRVVSSWYHAVEKRHKCMERVVCDHLTSMVVDKLDLLQFAYKAKRGVEDACLTLLDTVCRQLDSPHSHTQILFMDFSSAFNTVNPATLCNRLLDLQVHPSLILWIKDCRTGPSTWW